MTARTWRRTIVIGAVLLSAAPASAQITPAAARPTGRVSFYTSAWRLSTPDGASRGSVDLITNVTYATPDAEGNGLEFGVEMRRADYMDPNRRSRLSVYDAFVGARFADGHARVRVGQMWMNDLGGLGAIAGGLVEYRQSASTTGAGRLSIGAFAGVEPEPYTVGFVQGIRKMGGYAAIEGRAGRRHVLGFVQVGHGGLLERSVVTSTNFLPIKSRFFVYQAAEYDLVGPAGQPAGAGLTYFMLNAHAVATSRLDLQALYHRGRSIDTRSITDDVLAGRPVRDGALDGLLYESAGGRVTVRLTRDARVNAGYTRDRNNRDSAATNRVTLGASVGNIAGSGLDATVSQSRISRPTGQYSSLYVSIGRQLGRLAYISGDYSSSVSIVQFTRSDGLTIVEKPRTDQIGVSANISMSRTVSLTATAEQTRDERTSDIRVLAGVTVRMR